MSVKKYKEKISAFFACRLNMRRMIMTVFGVALLSVSVGFFNNSRFGTDPFQCLCNGLSLVVPIDFGTLYIIINALMLLAVFFMDRHFIGLGTFINLFLTGYIVQFSNWAIAAIFPAPGLALRILFLIIGVIAMALACAIYFVADMGVSVYDAIALHLDKKLPVPFRLIRIGTDFVCVGVGFALGAIVGVGTLVTAFFMGPLIDFFVIHMIKPWYLRKTQA